LGEQQRKEKHMGFLKIPNKVTDIRQTRFRVVNIDNIESMGVRQRVLEIQFKSGAQWTLPISTIDGSVMMISNQEAVGMINKEIKEQ